MHADKYSFTSLFNKVTNDTVCCEVVEIELNVLCQISSFVLGYPRNVGSINRFSTVLKVHVVLEKFMQNVSFPFNLPNIPNGKRNNNNKSILMT